jgi:hypothetical protein
MRAHGRLQSENKPGDSTDLFGKNNETEMANGRVNQQRRPLAVKDSTDSVDVMSES